MNRYKPAHITITLLVLMVMLVITTTAAIALGIATMQNNLRYNTGESALLVAQSGAENAILRLLRDPSYTGDIDLPIDEGSATITVSGSGPLTVVSVGSVRGHTRTVTVQATIANGQLTLNSWIQE